MKNTTPYSKMLGYKIASRNEEVEYREKYKNTHVPVLIDEIAIRQWVHKDDMIINVESLNIYDILMIKDQLFGLSGIETKRYYSSTADFVIKIPNLKALIKKAFYNYVRSIEYDLCVYKYGYTDDNFLTIKIGEDYKLSNDWGGKELSIHYNSKFIDAFSILDLKKDDIYYTDRPIRIREIVSEEIKRPKVKQHY